MNLTRSITYIEYNIIQAPMAGGIVTPSMVALICESGMLGAIAGGYLTIDSLKSFIQQTKSLTSLPFCVNVFIEEQRIEPMILKKPNEVIAIEKILGLDISDEFVVPPTVAEPELVNLIIQENVPLVSCTFGFFSQESVRKLKSVDIKIIGTATTIDEAKYCAYYGADAIVLQGTEAGGHQGSFLRNERNNTTALELLNKVKLLDLGVALISAGGVSATNMHDYFKHEADYVQLGSSFMMTEESSIKLSAKKFIEIQKNVQLVQEVTGKWARCIPNKLTTALKGSKHYSFPIQHYATSSIRGLAKETENFEYASLWAGANIDNLKVRKLSDLIIELQVAYKDIIDVEE